MTTASRHPEPFGGGGGANLADILERVLDKGIVIAGDIRINLLDIELLTIKLRLIVASVDKAKEMGIDWWEDDPALSSGARRKELAKENAELKQRLAELEEGSGSRQIEARDDARGERRDERRGERRRETRGDSRGESRGESRGDSRGEGRGERRTERRNERGTA
ncbi:gas vesicle protein [Streptomyces sp. NBC_00006]|uniref:gas vesicle protein n=1 Tax=unclassified Streptomyces TaxID=2593676 RepID=UPI002259A14C|nr:MULTISPECIES: gas vesicle protein [unclassified Streptomyces]MCX4830422.1 gas vesicle protein [Streptomyces sp. NBC_01016]MCX5530279.1 gas vesicle protein [Streptomyces sp. NBC_00006]